MAKDSPEKIKQHYKDMQFYAERNFKSYIESRVVIGKYWMIGKEEDACEICRENAKVGIIPLKDKFPSGHLHPPAGIMCRCAINPTVD